MSTATDLHLLMEIAYQRRALFAVELLDAATLERVSEGIRVVAVGLRGQPVVNASGLVVWFDEDFTRLKRLVVEPGPRPYEAVELDASEVVRPLTTIELAPRVDYPFPAGITGLRGRLIEAEVSAPDRSEPVRNATVQLEWQADDLAWQRSEVVSHSSTKGDFVTILRLSLPNRPPVNTTGSVDARLCVKRPGEEEQVSDSFKLPFGRVTDPFTFTPSTFAWNQLIPRIL